MKRISLFAFAAVTLASLACGGGSTTYDVSSLPSVPVDPTWADLKLPLDGGSVTWCDPNSCTITHQGSVADIDKQYVDHITGLGWKKNDMMSVPGVTTLEGPSMKVSVTTADALSGNAMVSIVKMNF